MGLDVVVKDAVATDYIDITSYPVLTDLSVLHYLSTDAASSIVNKGSSGPAVAGANVTYAAGYATFSGDPTAAANHFQTQESDGASTDFTRIAVFQRMDATDRPLFGQFAGAATGSGILQSQAFYSNGSALVSKSLGLAAGAASSFSFVAQRYASVGGINTMTTFLGSGGALVNLGAVTGAARVPNTLVAERIGGATSAAINNGISRIAMVAKHRSARTDAEIALIYAFMQFEAVRRGITLA